MLARICTVLLQPSCCACEYTIKVEALVEVKKNTVKLRESSSNDETVVDIGKWPGGKGGGGGAERVPLSLTSSPSSSGRWCSWYCVLVPVTYHRVSTPHRLNVPPSRHWPVGVGVLGGVQPMRSRHWYVRRKSHVSVCVVLMGLIRKIDKTQEKIMTNQSIPEKAFLYYSFFFIIQICLRMVSTIYQYSDEGLGLKIWTVSTEVYMSVVCFYSK